MRKIWLIFALMVYVGNLSGQLTKITCGTLLHPHDSTWLYQLPWFGNNQILIDFLEQTGHPESVVGTENLTCGGTTPVQYRIPVTVSIVTKTDSTGGIKEFEVDSIIGRINQIFYDNGTSIGLYLICEPYFIHDTQLFSGLKGDSASMEDLYIQRDTDGAIDLFFIDSTRSPIHGIARFPQERFAFHATVITRRPGLALIAETTAHEIGHCLNLFHTADGNRCGSLVNHDCGNCKQESVSRTRGQGLPCDFIGHRKCEINGDFLCDTEADPGAHEESYVTNCTFGPAFGPGFTNTDNWGDTWSPDITNVMSYATGCRSTFTPMQTAILRGSVTSYIPGFFPRVENDFDVFEPDNYPETATSLPLGDVQCHTFHWSPLSPNEFSACDADWYRVVVPNDGALSVKTFAVPGQPEPDTYLELFDSALTMLAANDSLLGSDFAWIPATNLAAGTYFIRASHRSMSGTPESRGHYHIQANLTAPVAMEHADNLQPLVFMAYDLDEQALNIHFKRCKPGTYTFAIIDLQGRIPTTRSLQAVPGARHRITLDLPSGIYLARLISPTASVQKKFVVF